MVPFVIFGLLCVTFGVTVYIILPQALLAENAGLILQIFFLILGGLILGLTLLVANLRGFIEVIMTYLLLFWERKSMRALIKKNLVAHKGTNKLTSIIYALTLGCVIFLCVALNLVLKSTESYTFSSDGDDVQYKHADLVIYTTGGFRVTEDQDDVLRQYAPDIKDFGYATTSLIIAFVREYNFSALAAASWTKNFGVAVAPYGITPSSYFDSTL